VYVKAPVAASELKYTKPDSRQTQTVALTALLIGVISNIKSLRIEHKLTTIFQKPKENYSPMYPTI
jgi:hypothetical protein